MLDDFRSAVRGFRHRPGVATMIVATLALGIGANAAIFAAVDAILLKPLPYPDADRLVSIYELNRWQRGATQLVAPVRLEEWNRANRTLEGLAGCYFENMTDTSGPLPERIEAMRTSPAGGRRGGDARSGTARVAGGSDAGASRRLVACFPAVTSGPLRSV